ncbi:Hypothetical protein, putative [Bodo saltans]|uniref:Uncharacterized protein n=1 Tax=Bodo saltans TaxID=75058 RepID=A0A0S4JKI5_BODSA|nr:Hypothetical protein, putative [Bodo saltans]|eukprot:CUG90898.1 Hypothetical protein, putative [Bodo saltans]
MARDSLRDQIRVETETRFEEGGKKRILGARRDHRVMGRFSLLGLQSPLRESERPGTPRCS